MLEIKSVQTNHGYFLCFQMKYLYANRLRCMTSWYEMHRVVCDSMGHLPEAFPLGTSTPLALKKVGCFHVS